MNFSTLSAADKRIVIAAALVVIISVLSYVDPSGNWGGVMVLALVGGLFGLFVVLQPQLAPTVKLPMTRGLSLLVAGALATGGLALAVLTYIGYISRNIVDPFVILMIVGLIAAIFVLWMGWQAYQAEPKAAAPAAPASPTAATAPPPPAPAPAAPPPAPPAAPPAEPPPAPPTT